MTLRQLVSHRAVGLEAPVPPHVVPMVVAFQVPVVIVPMDDKDDNVVTSVLTKVPDTGSVTLVPAVVVNASGKAPKVDKFPASVIVLAPLLMPVPPNWGAMIVPFQVPVVMVPSVVIFVLPLLIELLTVIAIFLRKLN